MHLCSLSVVQAEMEGITLSGALHVKADDGTEREVKTGEVSMLTGGHDAWVVGDAPVVVIDFQGMVDYAKER